MGAVRSYQSRLSNSIWLFALRQTESVQLMATVRRRAMDGTPQSLNPEWIATQPEVRLVYVTARKPASRSICAKSSCLGNLRIDSTRYWYDARSEAISSPIFGMTPNEYFSYTAASTGFVTCENSRQRKRPPGRSTRCASRSASSMRVTLRMPKAIVYKSNVLSSKGSCRASAVTHSSRGADGAESEAICSARRRPSASMFGLMSLTTMRAGSIPPSAAAAALAVADAACASS
mmetsp:Transcript_86777/g.173218  ORF Transcript_86777/g.173218 Transcript_86777/m.173218 type:complete len:233 (-) Transcript_86777:373-1071(-)